MEGGSIREADGLGAEVVCLLQEQGAVLVEVFAGGSEPEPSAFALQEDDPEGRLQSRDLLRHGGLRDFASLCRFGECAAFYNSRKISEPSEQHRRASSFDGCATIIASISTKCNILDIQYSEFSPIIERDFFHHFAGACKDMPPKNRRGKM